MGLMGKKGPDTIDYTYLQKKGLIKKKIEKESPYKVNSQGMIDLTSSSPSINKSQVDSVTSTQSTTTNIAQNPFGFLDNLAASASSPVVENKINNENPDLGFMKIKVEDLEYKLDRLVEKLSLIESKLSSFESKVFN